MTRTRPLLAATLIVRDEAEALPGCLAALRGVVDEVCVYDTGSVDQTVMLARRAGARVLQGHWDGDFARARNAALAMTRATWALVVDADEVVRADAATLRAYLGGRVGKPAAGDLDCMTAHVVNTGADGRHEHGRLTSVRVFRTATVHYEGRVHELPARRDGSRPRAVDLPPTLLHLRHTGYATAGTVRAKAERNLSIAQSQLDDLVATGSEDRLRGARVLLDLGRSLLGVGRRQEAVEAFETLRALTGEDPATVPGDARPLRAQATALLAQVLLDEGGLDEVVLVLEADLRACGASSRYCDWLRAQALGRLGARDEALELLRGVDVLVDPMGNHHGLAQVLQARTLHAVAAGRFEEAGEALAAAMAVHGAARGQAPLLLELWAGREDQLATTLADLTGPAPTHLPALADQLRAAGGTGARVAAVLTGTGATSGAGIPS